MILRRTRLAAAALAAAALGSWPGLAFAIGAATDRLTDDVAAVEQGIAAAERAAVAPELPLAADALRRFKRGVQLHAGGDWLDAAQSLTQAVDEPAWATAPDRPRALVLLADALRRQGLCGAARVRYREVLALPDAAHRDDALTGALECAVRDRRRADVERLLEDAARAFRTAPPPEVRYLAAKAAYQRRDLPGPERVERALEAFARVGGPFQLRAWYFQGVLELEDENLRGSLEWFESCARAEPETEGDREVHELCLLAAGRVHAELGDVPAALDWYGAVPAGSPHFAEAVHEMALAHVKAKAWDPALRLASLVAELAPGSPLAPEAMILRGHLLLRLERYADAAEAYGRVIDTYAPVRDELDAILVTRADPARYFDELLGKQAGLADVASLLPPVAVRWATSDADVALALELVRALGDAGTELREGRELADRLGALLGRGGGLDASPPLLRAYARAQAVENAAARVEGAWVAEVAAAALGALPPERREALARAGQDRAALEARFDRLPRSDGEVAARLRRLHGRVDEVSRAAYRLGYLVEGSRAAIAGCLAWADEHRGDGGDADARQEFADELRKHRAMVDGYEAELAAVRLELAKVRDAAGGADAMVEEGRLRDEYLAAVAREHAAAEAARADVLPADRPLLAALRGARGRLAAARARAQALEARIAADAARRAATLRARVEVERGALAAHAAAVAAVRDDARDVLGRIAVRSVGEVRALFYRLVLKADVGIVDVSWSRKRRRLERVQALAVERDLELQQLGRDDRAVLGEVE